MNLPLLQILHSDNVRYLLHPMLSLFLLSVPTMFLPYINPIVVILT